MPANMTVSAIDSAEQLAGMCEAWNSLLDGADAEGPCLRWEWINTWWEIYHDCGAALHVLAVHERDELVGLVPLFTQCRKRFGLLPIRILRFVGTGEPEFEEVASEYLDIIARRGREAEVSRAVWQHLEKDRSWDQVIFNDVLDGSMLRTTFTDEVTRAGFFIALRKTGIRYFIDLPDSWSSYLATLDRGSAKRLEYRRRRFEREGHVEMRRVEQAQALDSAFDDLVRLHTSRWKSRGQPGAFAAPRFIEFHRRLTRLLLPRNMLDMGALVLDGLVIAMTYNIRCNATVYFYQGGFDVEAAAKYSPGILAQTYAIDAAMRDRQVRYDFMKGGTASYKAEFGCTEVPMHTMLVHSRGLRGRLLALEHRLRHFSGMLRRKIQSLSAVP